MLTAPKALRKGVQMTDGKQAGSDPASAGGSRGMRSQLRGMSFEQGAAALAPVQLKEGDGPTKAPGDGDPKGGPVVVDETTVGTPAVTDEMLEEVITHPAKYSPKTVTLARERLARPGHKGKEYVDALKPVDVPKDPAAGKGGDPNKSASPGMDYCFGNASGASVNPQDNVKAQITDTRNATHTVSSFTQVGMLLDGLAPTWGSGVTGVFSFKIEPPEGMGFYLDLQLKGSVKRSMSGKLEVEGSVSVTAGLAAKAEVDLGWYGKYGASWHAGVHLGVGVNAVGSTGWECMDMMSLPIRTQVEKIAGGDYASNFLFGKDREADILKNMGAAGTKDEDSLEYYAEIGGVGGAGVTKGHEGAEAELGVDYRSVTKIGKGADGKKQTSTESGIAGHLDFAGKVHRDFGEFAAQGGIEWFNPSGEKKADYSIKAEVSSHGGMFAAAAFDAGVIGGLFMPLWQICKGSDDEVARGALGYASVFPSGVIAGKMADHAHHHPDTLGAHVGFEVIVKFKEGKFSELAVEAIRAVEVEIGPKVPGKEMKFAGMASQSLYHGHAGHDDHAAGGDDHAAEDHKHAAKHH